MDSEHRYTVDAKWLERRRGEITGDCNAPKLAFAAPPDFQGDAGVWTPEHFFVAAIASCLITTFKAIAEFSKFEFLGLQCSAEGVLEKAEGGFRFTRVLVKPSLTVCREEDRERGLRLLEKAERSCLISRSVQPAIELMPTVQVAGVTAG